MDEIDMPDVTRISLWPTRLRWLAVVCGGLAVLCGILAGVEFRALRHVTEVDVPLSKADIAAQPDAISGVFRDALPKFRLRWDGEPARAWLADRQSGEAIAPALMLKSSLSLNARGVLWLSDKDCRFAIDRATYESLGDRLVLRAEKFGSRGTFYAWMYAAIGLGLCSFAFLQQAHIYSARVIWQPKIRAAETRAMAFVLISILSVLAFYPGHPVPHMSGDPANIASFAAALAHPDAFAGDAVLSDPKNFAWYTPLYVKFVRLFGDWGFHYGTSRALLVFLSTLAGLFGYFHLFRLISRSSAFAFVATLGLWFLKEHYPANEDWGPMLVLPRTVYGSLLPWVVVLALRWLSQPRWWWVPAAASATLFYVHPVSSPALTGAILTAFVFGGPGKLGQRIAWGGLGALVAIAVMFPYVMVYAGKYSGTVVTDPNLTAQAMEVARQRFAPEYLDPRIFYRELAIHLLITPRHWLGIAAFYLLCRYRRNSLTTKVSVGMLTGYVIVTCLIPAVDVTISSMLGRLPFQIDLIRNMRYLDVLFLGLVAAALREINRPDWGRNWTFQLRLAISNFIAPRDLAWKLVPGAAVVWATLFFAPPFARSMFHLAEFSYDNITILIGRPRGEMAQKIEAFRAVRTMRQPHEVVGGDFHMRQMGIPVAVNVKDLGVLAYSSPAKLVEAKRTLNAAASRATWPLDQSVAVDQAAILNANLLLLPRDSVTPGLARSDNVLFQNASYVLVRVDPRAVVARRNEMSQQQQVVSQRETTKY